MPKGVLLPDEEQESYIYIINGIKNDSPMLYKLIQELNADDEKPGDTDGTTNANPKITKDAQEITNAEQGLIRLYYDLGEELSKQTSNELNDDDKKIESAQKIYSLFHMIGKDKINNIGRLKSFTASSIL
ncbi:2767_t:CDS:1 [Funneliformis mosseae]|uniref:2767_t:CDS:1 n=1 Tax=Funneliformis mosseae TaxID=27381 RepID=A0A9N9BS78_FUNMO|nr:2767_t:CDS:1 [Funneliformis mosseae]